MRISRDELQRALPLAGALALVLASLYVLKPARNALFLSHAGIDQLPYVLMMVAAAGGAVSSVFGRLTDRISVERLIPFIYLSFIATLIVFRLLLPLASSAVVYAFYIWVNLYGVVATSLIWLLANSVFDPREARRTFGWLGTGGILGAIAGGFLSVRVADFTGTENLLLVCAVLDGLCLLLLRMVRADPRAHAVKRRRAEDTTGTLSAIRRSPLLRVLVPMAAIIGIISVIVDVQFNQIVDHDFPTKDEKTAFFGRFFAVLNAFAFLFQIVLTPRILGVLGVVPALLILPLTLGAGALTSFFVPGLPAMTVAKAGDIGLRHSIHKSATEILYLPIPGELRRRAKVFIDAAIESLSTGVAALLVLLLTGTFGLSYRDLSVLTLALVAAWIALSFALRRAYLDAFRRALEKRAIDPQELRTRVAEAAALTSLRATLSSAETQERQLLYALDLSHPLGDRALIDPLRGLLTHRSPDVRRRAIRNLQVAGDERLLSDVEPLVADADPHVSVEAMSFVFHATRASRTSRNERLQNYLGHADQTLRVAAIAVIAEHGSREDRNLLEDSMIAELMAADSPARARLAGLICALPEPRFKKYLLPLLSHPSPEATRAAIEGVARSGDRAYVPWLIEQLRDPRARPAARQALVRFGHRIAGTLNDYLVDGSLELSVRHQIARALSEIADQSSADNLLANLERVEPSLRHPVLQALAKLRAIQPKLRFDRARVNAALATEVETYAALAAWLRALEKSPRDLLSRALEEKRLLSLEQIFLILALRYPAKDMHDAHRAVAGRDARVRASAIEFLDNVLRGMHKKLVLELLDARSAGHASAAPEPEPLAQVISGPDAWLRSCGAYRVLETQRAELLPEVMRLESDPDPIVAETAALVCARLR